MTKINRQQIYKKYNGHCAYCGKDIAYKEMQVDHLHPKSLLRPIGRGLQGDFIYPDINDPINLMPSCRRCNHYKRANKLEAFRHILKIIHERIHDNYIVKVAEDYGIVIYNKWDELFYFEKQQ